MLNPFKRLMASISTVLASLRPMVLNDRAAFEQIEEPFKGRRAERLGTIGEALASLAKLADTETWNWHVSNASWPSARFVQDVTRSIRSTIASLLEQPTRFTEASPVGDPNDVAYICGKALTAGYRMFSVDEGTCTKELFVTREYQLEILRVHGQIRAVMPGRILRMEHAHGISIM